MGNESVITSLGFSDVNCSNDFPSTDHFYAEILLDSASIPLLAVGSLLMLVVIVIFLEEVWYLHFNYHDQAKRRRILVILGIYPVICSCSFLAVLVPRSTVLDDFLGACYLAVGIYQFVQLTIEYYGGQDAMILRLIDTKIPLRGPPLCCCCCCLPAFALNKKTLMILVGTVLQAAILKPIVAFISGVLWTDGKYEVAEMTTTSAYAYLNSLSVVSTLIALYGLILTYRASLKPLKDYRLRMKFFAIQIVIIVNNLQNLIFMTILAKLGIPACIGSRGPRIRASSIHHLILVAEMFLLSILARFAYRHTNDLHVHVELKSRTYVNDEKQVESINTNGKTNGFHTLLENQKIGKEEGSHV